MANQNYRIFPNRVEMFKFFGTYSSDLNVGVSSRLPPNGFCVGTQHKAFRNSVEFYQAISELTGLDIDVKTSTERMGTFIVFFNSPLPNPNRRGKAVAASIAPITEEVKAEAPSSDVDAVLAEATALNDETDKKGSKDKLAEFAASKGVTLLKTKTFENMIIDFKAALEA